MNEEKFHITLNDATPAVSCIIALTSNLFLLVKIQVNDKWRGYWITHRLTLENFKSWIWKTKSVEYVCASVWNWVSKKWDQVRWPNLKRNGGKKVPLDLHGSCKKNKQKTHAFLTVTLITSLRSKRLLSPPKRYSPAAKLGNPQSPL